MTPRTLLRNPNLKLINDQAKNFLQDFHQGNVLALARYSLFESLPDTSNLRLADAQQMIAREYGYASWPKLKQHVDALARDLILWKNSWVYSAKVLSQVRPLPIAQGGLDITHEPANLATKIGVLNKSARGKRCLPVTPPYFGVSP